MKRLIAIVEDEAAIRDNYAAAFTREGYAVRCYANRVQAMAAFNTRLPDLAVIDISGTMGGKVASAGGKTRMQLTQAAAAGHSTEEELDLLCTHGILHLLGYDHGEPDEEREMFGLQKRILDDWRAARGETGPSPAPTTR